MGIEQTLIDEIVRRICGVLNPQRVIMFGSAAAGTMHRDSDIDLLVLLEQTTQARRESVKLLEALRGLGYPFDVLVMEAERFEESKSVAGGIAYPAHHFGKVIYAAA